MDTEKYIEFLKGAASPYHVVDMVKHELDSNGFKYIKESQEWNIEPNQGYYFVRDQTCITAFVTPDKIEETTPFTIIGTHTDSPSLKLKPMTLLRYPCEDVVPVEVYGSPILQSWFDRPLRLGGRVIIQTKDGLHSKLVKTETPVGVIPNLAIHMWSTRQNPPQMNPSIHIRVMLSPEDDDMSVVKSKVHTICKMHPQNELLLNKVIKELAREHGLEETSYDIVSWDLEFSNFTAPYKVGELIIGEKQDNLAHCFTAMEAIINAKKENTSSMVKMVCMFNNEEVGSNTREGAMSSLIFETIKRITSIRAVPHSFVLSADVSHGLHPNYKDETDPYSRCSIGKGICLKVDSRCGYSNSGSLASVVISIAAKHNSVTTDNKDSILLQSAAKKNGTLGGSTIGPMTASKNHIRSCDVGIPLLAMHSICETAHVKDFDYTLTLFNAFFKTDLDVQFFDELD